MDTADDSDLISQVLAGSQEAAHALFERHWTSAWWTAYAILGDRTRADDVAQESIARAFSSLHRFDLGRPFRPWLARIAANDALNVVRARRREVLTAEPSPNGHRPDASERFVEHDRLIEAMRTLSEDRRMVVALRYFGDLEPAEIAHALDLPIGTVSSRLSRALTELRVLLEVPR